MNRCTLLSLAVLLVCTAALAADIYVPADYTTIQDAVTSAANDDVIWVADGTYTGAGNTDIDFLGKPVTVRSVNGPAACIIDCQASARGVIFQSAETNASVLDGVTITDGYAADGGGIYCDASPLIRNCLITGCEATGDGGGIRVSDGSGSAPQIVNCTLDTNTAGHDGGGIYGEYMTVSECRFTGNTASHYGGGVFGSNFDLSHSTLESNNAVRGGGAYIDWIDTVLYNCLVTGNTCSEYGGGIYCRYQNGNEFHHCTITGNTAGFNGGGVALSYSEQIVTHCIVWNNTPNAFWWSYDSGPAATYSLIEGGHPGTGNLDRDPLFVSGPQGGYYISQAPTESIDSRCLDGGAMDVLNDCFSTPLGILCMDRFTTRSDDAADTGTVDIGFHYPASTFATPTPTATVTETPTGTPPTPEPTETVTPTPEPTVIQVPLHYGTIQAAINAARNGDTVLVADGTYTGLWNKELDFHGKSITVTSENGAGSCVIDCESDGYGVAFQDGETHDSILDGFTIVNGAYSSGAGIIVAGADPVIRNCIVDTCSAAGDGGGIFLSGDTSALIDTCTFTGCLAGNDGGGAYAALPAGSGAKFSRCTFDTNFAGHDGGGMFFEFVTIHDCRFTGNAADRYGGGAFGNSASVSHCRFDVNTAARGGGLYMDWTETVLYNCLITGNTCTEYGGGIFCRYENGNEFHHCTVTGNSAGLNGGGIALSYSEQIVTHCILWDNAPNAFWWSYDNGPAATYSLIEGGYPGIGNLDQDPLFVTGIQGDYYLSQIPAETLDSRCLDAGAVTVGRDCFSTPFGILCMDRFTTRSDDAPDTGTVDIGFHYPASTFATPTPTATVTETPTGTPPTPVPTETATPTPEPTVIQVPLHFGTIQAAINAARNGDTVLVADGTYTGLWNKELDFHGKTITVTSENGAAACIIDCENDGFGVIFQDGETHDSILDGFTIVNGENPYGGGLQIYSSNPLIRNCVITACHASGYGGGILIGGTAAPTLQSCRILSNAADTFGGGIYTQPDSLAVFESCRIADNTAGDDGGGIFSASIILTDCTIAENESLDLGGGLHMEESVLTHCVISGNTAARGGGFYITNYNTSLENCLVIANTSTEYGGGGFIRYQLNNVLKHCTVTGNSSANGGGIWMYYGGQEYTHCILWDNTPDTFHWDLGNDPVVTYSDLPIAYSGTGNISQDPEFISGPLGDQYLSQVSSGQALDSPCLDAGNGNAGTICYDSICMDSLTTRTDGQPDSGIVDMGYHFTPVINTPTPSPTATATPIPSETPTITPTQPTATATPVPPLPASGPAGIVLLLTALSSLLLINRRPGGGRQGAHK